MSRPGTVVSLFLLLLGGCGESGAGRPVLPGSPGKPDADPAPYREAYARLGRTPDPTATGCISCHQGINDLSMIVLEWGASRAFRDPELQKRFETEFPDPAVRDSMIRVLMAHPKPDVIAGPHSAHPTFSCAQCHVYEDRRDDPALTADRKKYWIEHHMKYHPVLQDMPMRLTHRQQAMCLKCHMGEEPLPGAEVINRGRWLYMATACHTCHVTEGMKILEADLGPGEKTVRRPGPPLHLISGKVDKTWMFNWVAYPPAFRPTARMPPVFPRGSIVGKLPPEIARESLPKERIAEIEEVLIASVVEYIFSISSPVELDEIPEGLLETEDWKIDDQRARGESLVMAKGCLGCHRVDDAYPPNYKLEQIHLEEEFATSLFASGDKFDSSLGRRWLFTWLRNPRHYNPETPMPRFELTDRERADIVQYLVSLKIDNEARKGKGWKPWEPKEPPIRIDGDEVRISSRAAEILDELLAYQGGPTEAPLKEKVLWEGRKVVEVFTCYSCHRLGGDWDTKPVVWGTLSHDLLPPRQIMSRMPLFELNAEESNLMVTYLWGAIEGTRPPPDRHRTSPRRKTLTAGERVIEKYNCQGCHTLEMVRLYVRDGDRIRSGEVNFKGRVERTEELDRPQWSVDWLRRPHDWSLPEIAAKYPVLVPSYLVERFEPARGGVYAFRRIPLLTGEEAEWASFKMPPSLRTAGRKLDPDWLRGFLRNPTRLSPTRDAVMPRFDFEEEEIETLVEYFRARDGAVPEDARGRLSAEELAVRFPALRKADRLLQTGCTQCHTVDGVGTGLSVDLGLVHRRLQRPWVREFLKDPQSFYPGSPMPTLPDDASVEDVTDLLTNYAKYRSVKVRLGDPGEVLEALRSPEEDAAALFDVALARMAVDVSLREAVGPALTLAVSRRLPVAAGVARLLGHPEGAVRQAAVETLVRMEDRSRLDRIAEILGDPDPGVRRAAVVALERLRDAPRFSTVASRLWTDPDGGVRATATRAAAVLLPAAEAVPALGARLADSDERVLRAAVEGLAAIEAREQAAAVAALLRSGSIPLRALAAEALGAMRAKDQTPALREALRDEAVAVRIAALLALGKLGEAPPVARGWMTEGTPALRAAAAACLMVAGDPAGIQGFRAAVSQRPFDAPTRRVIVEALIALLPEGELGRRVEPGRRTVREWLAELGAEAEVDGDLLEKLEEAVESPWRAAWGLLGEITKWTGLAFVFEEGKLRAVGLDRAIERFISQE